MSISGVLLAPYGLDFRKCYREARTARGMPGAIPGPGARLALIAFAAYQSGQYGADLSRNVPRYLAEFSAFAFAILGVSGFFPAAVPLTGFIGRLDTPSLDSAIAIVL